VWNYHDEDLPAPPATINLAISGVPQNFKRGLVEHFRIDAAHSNAFTAWKDLGSPQQPTPKQYEKLESAGQLELLSSPQWIELNKGTAHLEFNLPRQGLSLIRLGW
jgi:xylan 1,4-beta-xylosidase